VDGKNDGKHYKLSDNSTSKISSFYNMDSTMKHKFIFSSTEWTEENVNLKKIKHGGLGAISVYFYKAKQVKRKKKENRSKKLKSASGDDVSNVSIEQAKIPEMKKCIDIVYTTKFAEGEEVISSHVSDQMKLVAIDNEPLAVLHINYRPIEWFDMKGITIHEEVKKAVSPTIVELNNDECENTISKVEVLVNRKRKTAEVIEIL
jgi:hypothetical protein